MALFVTICSGCVKENSLLMSRLNLGKKLIPAGKAWRSFATTVRRKIHKLKTSQGIKKTTSRLNNAVSAVTGSSKFVRSVTGRRRRRAFARPPCALRHHNHHKKLGKSLEPVYVDELFFMGGSALEPSASTSKERGKCVESGSIKELRDLGATTETVETQKVPETKLRDGPATATTRKEDETSTSNKGSDSWEGSASAVQELGGVDERAEEFIANFREEMKLQRQRSFGEYQEMLARGL